MTAKPAALDGIKVLDLSRVLAGPWCTQILADLGADVVKIERPGVGDETRTWGPPFLKDSNGEETDQATYFTACNRNKRSVTIDMATSEGRALFDERFAKARGLAVTLPRQAGDGIAHITSVASPLRLSSTPPVLRNAAPALGQHTDEVLAELGITASRIAELRSAQVV